LVYLAGDEDVVVDHPPRHLRDHHITSPPTASTTMSSTSVSSTRMRTWSAAPSHPIGASSPCIRRPTISNVPLGGRSAFNSTQASSPRWRGRTSETRAGSPGFRLVRFGTFGPSRGRRDGGRWHCLGNTGEVVRNATDAIGPRRSQGSRWRSAMGARAAHETSAVPTPTKPVSRRFG
jgi:hypothetical protein